MRRQSASTIRKERERQERSRLKRLERRRRREANRTQGIVLAPELKS